jgi:hypothetical protein
VVVFSSSFVPALRALEKRCQISLYAKSGTFVFTRLPLLAGRFLERRSLRLKTPLANDLLADHRAPLASD